MWWLNSWGYFSVLSVMRPLLTTTEPPVCLTDHLLHSYPLITRYHLLLLIQPGSCIIGRLCAFFCLLLFTEASQQLKNNWRRMNSGPVSHLCCFCFLIFLKIRLSDTVHLLRGCLFLSFTCPAHLTFLRIHYTAYWDLLILKLFENHLSGAEILLYTSQTYLWWVL